MSRNKRALIPPEDAPGRYVFAERPRCPDCGSGNLKTTKTSREQSDGADPRDDTLTRFSLCRQCGRRFILVLD